MLKFITLASYQGPAIQGDPDKAFTTMISWIAKAEQQKADFVLFPETFMHGYFDNKKQAIQFSIDLTSDEFEQWCKKLQNFEPVIIFGINERECEKIYNTTLVMHHGRLLGKMRKTTTYKPYDYYNLGHELPIFQTYGIRFGIVICADINEIEPTRTLALKGAQIIFLGLRPVLKTIYQSYDF